LRHVTKGTFERTLVAIPPFNEQKRIADKLDAVLTRVDARRERLDRVPAILKCFRQAVLAAATSGKLTEEWRTSTQPPNARALIESMVASNRGRRGLSDSAPILEPADADWEYPDTWVCETAASLLRKGVLADLKDGNHGANHPRVADFTTEGLPFITAAQVNNFRVDYENAYKLSGAPLERLRVGFAQANDVVLTHKGSVGRVALVDRDCVLTPQTTYYRANTDFLLPTYLMYYLASVPFSKQLDAIKSQTTRDFVPISQQYSLWHLIPSLQEQHEIVRRVEAPFAYADRLEARYTAARAQVERLSPALLGKAFRGELVPQDSSDEPASMLLERIRAARAVAGEKPPKTVRTERNPMTTKLTTDALKEIIRDLPSDRFTFDDLRGQVPTDYETLKDMVFALLFEAPASIKQVFDAEAQNMQLVRVNR
jgi:type I restriction enzyme, S subunit